MIKYRTIQANRGFSLIEMLVSIALFAVVVTTSVGTLLVLVDANAKSQSIQIAINNLSFAVDVMARQLRTGTDFYCGFYQSNITSGSSLESGARNCTNGLTHSAIAFTDTRTGQRIGYGLANSNSTIIQRRIDGVSGNAWLDMTSSNVRITNLDFWVTGSGSGDTIQPSITIFIEATVGDVTGLGSQFQLQTTVVQRKLDI